MLKTLKSLCKKQAVAVYSDACDTSRFIYGKILSVNESQFAIYAVSPSGKFDGILMKQIDDVLRIEIDGQYSRIMDKLCCQEEWAKFPFEIGESEIGIELLRIAEKTQNIVSIELEKSGLDDVVGIVLSIDENVCLISQIDSHGEKDGCVYVSLERITQISYMSEQEQKILKLFTSVE